MSEKMTGLIKDNRSKLLVFASFLCFVAVASVYVTISFIGYVTFIQGYESIHGISIFLSGVYLMILSPGLSTLMIAYFFFLRRKSWMNLLLGVFVCLISAAIHLFISIPAAHLEPSWAFMVGLVEVSITVLILVKLKRYLTEIEVMEVMGSE